MKRDLISPPLGLSFGDVFDMISRQPESKTPELLTTGKVPFVAEAKHSRDVRRFIALPHSNRIYEHDWGFRSNHMGKAGQRIGQYAVPIDKWASGFRGYCQEFYTSDNP
ncbi:MAG: hypothetical protein PHV74_12190 [Dehalococcoidia bacterium]|nr:hypothetical protein [Dehalococcoidia bacterium]